MYNIYSIVILILFDIPRFSVNYLHQIQVAAPSPSSRKSTIGFTREPVEIARERVETARFLVESAREIESPSLITCVYGSFRVNLLRVRPNSWFGGYAPKRFKKI